MLRSAICWGLLEKKYIYVRVERFARPTVFPVTLHWTHWLPINKHHVISFGFSLSPNIRLPITIHFISLKKAYLTLTSKKKQYFNSPRRISPYEKYCASRPRDSVPLRRKLCRCEQLHGQCRHHILIINTLNRIKALDTSHFPSLFFNSRRYRFCIPTFLLTFSPRSPLQMTEDRRQ